MTQQADTPAGGPGEARGSKSAVARFFRFLGRHPIGVVQAVLLLLVAIVVLQNVESTSIDLLFWSLPELPKLVLIFGSMLVGAAAWEILRRWLRR